MSARWVRRWRKRWRELAYPVRDGFIFRPGVNPRGLRVRLRAGGPRHPGASYAVEADGLREMFSRLHGNVARDASRIYHALHGLYRSPAAREGWIDLNDLEQARAVSWDIVQRAVGTWQMRMDVYKARNRPQLAREMQRAIAQLDRVDADLAAVAQCLTEAAEAVTAWQRGRDATARGLLEAQRVEDLREQITRQTGLSEGLSEVVPPIAPAAEEIAEAVHLRVAAARELLHLG